MSCFNHLFWFDLTAAFPMKGIKLKDKGKINNKFGRWGSNGVV